VLPDKVLHQLAQIRPTTMGALGCISGIGDKKMSQYGASLVDRLQAYSRAHDLPTNVGLSAGAVASAAPGGGDGRMAAAASSSAAASGQKRPRVSSSAEETWKMMHGLGDDPRKRSLEDVADARGIKPNTAVDHLIQCLDSGNDNTTCEDLDWSLVKLDRSVVDKVERALGGANEGEVSFYQLKSALGALQPSQYNMVKLARLRYYATRGAHAGTPAPASAPATNKRSQSSAAASSSASSASPQTMATPSIASFFTSSAPAAAPATAAAAASISHSPR